MYTQIRLDRRIASTYLELIAATLLSSISLALNAHDKNSSAADS
jgi:hypothetical protein